MVYLFKRNSKGDWSATISGGLCNSEPWVGRRNIQGKIAVF
jgi:hypothetical protein